MHSKKLLLLLLSAFIIGAIGIVLSIQNPFLEKYDEEGILSFFEADLDEDGIPELLTLHRKHPEQKTDLGTPYGDTLKISKNYTLTSTKEHILSYEEAYSFDLASIKPLRVRAGDINGDGRNEISIIAYKTTKFHPVLAKRPFFYALTDGKLEKIWLGTRLSRPFTDFVLYDLDEDQIDEIVALEKGPNDEQILAVYDWEGFGFDLKTDYTVPKNNCNNVYSFKEVQHTPLEQLYLIQNHEKRLITLKEGQLCIEN